MTLDEKIHQYARKLPYSLQKELLDFIQYLLMKAEQQEKQEWLLFRCHQQCEIWKMSLLCIARQI